MTLLNVPLSRRSLFAALGWPTLFVILFYSLALHLYLGLGGWPPSIGVQPETLLFAVHAGVTGAFFWGGMIALPFIVAVAFLFALDKRNCPLAIYLLVFAFGFGVAFGATRFAPSGFTNWWWD